MIEDSSDKELTLRLEMKSDWHIGTGAGIPGSLDALLARDADGFPCVPAKTVVGIWRDAMETLTLGLDNGDEENKTWQEWINVIFGSQPNIDKVPTRTPRPSILSIQPARVAANLRDAIGEDERLKQALTLVKPNTAIEADSGTTKTDSLRFTEMGRIGTVLEASFKLNFDTLENVLEEQKDLIEALLSSSAALVERIGGHRRRGSGRCEMQVDGLVTKEKAVETIKKCQTVLVIPPVRQRRFSPEAAQPASGIEWRRINYSLKLQTPIAIVTNTLGNVSETLDFIPGTYLLPHITRQLNGISRYVASGDFQVLAATIDVQGERGMPVPRVFLQEKLDESRVYDRLKKTEELSTTRPQLKPLREGFISIQNGNFTYAKTPKVLLMHNTVDDPVQRPTENVGGVFSRQAIKAGTTLRGQVRFKKSIEDQAKGLERSKSNIRLGTSKKDDYGLAELTVGTLEEDESRAIVGDELIVYLESDVLLRSGNLRQTNLVEDLKTELEKVFGKGTLSEKDSLVEVRRIESWHQGWGLPRPTLIAMSAGSVVVFDGTTDETKLRALEDSGIGERRGEGYGRIRFQSGLLDESN